MNSILKKPDSVSDFADQKRPNSPNFHANSLDLNKKYGIPVRKTARDVLANLRENIQKKVDHLKHHLEYKHIDMNKVDEMSAKDFEGMCPHQREKIRKLRLQQSQSISDQL